MRLLLTVANEATLSFMIATSGYTVRTMTSCPPLNSLECKHKTNFLLMEQQKHPFLPQIQTQLVPALSLYVILVAISNSQSPMLALVLSILHLDINNGVGEWQHIVTDL